MPFNGGIRSFDNIKWDYRSILAYIQEKYPELEELESPNTSTSVNYRIQDWPGTIGIIPSFSRTFCGSCNRLRISANGDIITCLYANAYGNLRDILRKGDKKNVEAAIKEAIANRSINGVEAEKRADRPFSKSMTSIGG